MDIPKDKPLSQSQGLATAGTEEEREGKSGSKRVRSVTPEDVELPASKTLRPDTHSKLDSASAIKPDELSNFEQAKRFAKQVADCGMYYISFEEFRQFNTSRYPDYGTALLLLYAVVDQKTFSQNELREMLELALKRHRPIDCGSKAETLSNAVFSMPGNINANQVDEITRKALGESAEVAISELRKIFDERGFMDCIYAVVDSSDDENPVYLEEESDYSDDDSYSKSEGSGPGEGES